MGIHRSFRHGMGTSTAHNDRALGFMQSRDTKNLNVDNDLDEILIKIKHTGWNDSTRTRRFWTQDEDEDA